MRVRVCVCVCVWPCFPSKEMEQHANKVSVWI